MPTTKPLPRKQRILNRGFLYSRKKDDVKNPEVTLLDIDSAINYYLDDDWDEDDDYNNEWED